MVGYHDGALGRAAASLTKEDGAGSPVVIVADSSAGADALLGLDWDAQVVLVKLQMIALFRFFLRYI